MDPTSHPHLKELRERMVAFAASRHGRDCAEDLVQEALVVLQVKYPHVVELQDLVPLALQILRFKLAANGRKVVRHFEATRVDPEEAGLAGDFPDPQVVLERKELLARLHRGLQQLGERCRELFRLKLQGHSFPEIQAILGAGTLNTVYTWDHRCRKDLLDRMGGRWMP